MQGNIISDLDHLLLQPIPAYLYLYIAMQLIFDLHYFVLVTAFGGGVRGQSPAKPGGNDNGAVWVNHCPT